LGAAKLYPHAVPVLPQRPNRNLRRFLALYRDELPFVLPEDLPPRPVEQVILVDTQRLPPLRGLAADVPRCIIDHHPLALGSDSEVRHGEGQTGSTTTLLVEEIAEAGLSLSFVEATLLLLGVYEDTGSLTYATTTPRDLYVVGWLLKQGARLDMAREFLQYRLTRQQQELYDQLVDNTHTYTIQGRAVVIAAARMDEYVEEISTVAHHLRDLLDPDALFVLVEQDSHIQMVARSTTEAVDVGTLTEQFEGGGHSRAAAALIRGRSLQAVWDQLVQALNAHIRPPVTVRDIMSFGVHTLTPNTTVAQAEELMRRYGHEGFPVLDEGRVVGVLTRGEIDRALQHRLDQAPIDTLMHQGQIAVAPHDAVEQVQDAMIQHNVGQVPVVDGGQVVGIVTRTDLIKLWSQPIRPSRAQEIAARMESALPPWLLSLLREASRTAEEMESALYVVGGFVRDLLLGVPTLDLDLVVEGDAIRLARQLADRHGGRVRSHARFGTANWVPDRSDEETWYLSEQGLDFVSARTEFYERPTVLPQVERSSIRQDLHRRDFTINTLAIDLTPVHWGELLDYYGGERDLKDGYIRVLHSLSFVEDPTRILRAVRLEQRLAFRIEERTDELLRNALDLLDHTTSERIRQEFYLILEEERPCDIIYRLKELGVLHRLHPYLRCDTWLRTRFCRMRRVLAEGGWPLAGEPRSDITGGSAVRRRPDPAWYLALLTFRLGEGNLRAFMSRLKIVSREADLLCQVHGLRRYLACLEEERQKPSTLVGWLDHVSREALFVLWVATDSTQAREQIECYDHTYREARPLLTGEDLKEMGLEPGPIFGNLLELLRGARLDGEVKSRSDEEALAEELLGQWACQGYKPRRARRRRWRL
jgi:tRNA nucleotidyltransferase (CCA-adding enzyme)